MIQYFPIVTGSLTVLGNINVSGSITTSGSITISGSITSASFASTASYWSGSITNALSASFASTASFVANAQSASYVLTAQTASFVANAQTASYVLNAVSSSFASTASFVALAQSASNAVSAVTASYANNLTVAGTLTAQTLVVQTITSSVDFVTGSTRFGSTGSNTHVFTGSVLMTGSLAVGSGSFPQTFAVKISGSAYNGTNVWFQDGSPTDGISFGGNGVNSYKTLQTYGGALYLNQSTQNGLVVGGTSTLSGSLEFASGYFINMPWASDTRTMWERYFSGTYFQRISSNGSLRQLRIESNGAYGNASIVLDGQSNNTVTTTIVSDKFVVTGSSNFTSYIQAPSLYGKSYAQTSSSGSYSVVDTGIYNSIDYQSGVIFLVSYGGNPLGAGSNYFANYLGALSVTTGYIGGAVKQYIVYTPITQFDASGAGSLSALTAVFWNGTTETTTISNSSTSYQIRLKIGPYNPVGSGQYVYLLRMGQ
jgi:hypothetical protein